MSIMSIGYLRRSNPEFIKRHVVIVQYSHGSVIECATCGGPVLTQGEFADAVGVKLSSLQSFLHRRPVRPDVAAKITAAVLAVRKEEEQ